MNDMIRTQRFVRLDRALEEGRPRTFNLRKFEGIPTYTGVLQPVSSFSHRDHDDVTSFQRRTPSPASAYRYLWVVALMGVVLLTMGVQSTFGLPTLPIIRTIPSQFVRQLSAQPTCPVCTCNNTS